MPPDPTMLVIIPVGILMFKLGALLREFGEPAQKLTEKELGGKIGFEIVKAVIGVVILTLGFFDILSDPHEEVSKVDRSPLNVTYTEARRILWKGNPPLMFAWVLNPLRAYLFDPVMILNSVALPLFMPPSIQRMHNRVFRFTWIPLFRILYSKEPPRTIETSVENSILHQPRALPIKPPDDNYSAFIGAVSFTASTIRDIAGVVANPAKYTGWISALSQFNNFLQETGIQDELNEAIQKPLLAGRLIPNFKILNDVQEQVNADRVELAQKDNISKQELQELLNIGHRLMRYATAAYGTEMVRAALDESVESPDVFDDHKKAISLHAFKREEGEIPFIYSDENASFERHVLHHFVAVNHTRKEVILAIRGTLDLSGAIVDIQGMAAEYCTGFAHKGISEMASNLWDCSGEKIAELMEEFSSYKLLITGHSLGAGTACLLNMQLHVNEVFKGRTVRCYAFAPPPTFWPCTERFSESPTCEGKVQKAMESTIAYVHDNDVVPFLSITAIRRMVDLLDAVDNETEKLWFWKRLKIFHDWDQVPEQIVKSVASRSKIVDRVEGECHLIIPADCVVWCREGEKGQFASFACDAYKMAETDIFLTSDMVTDHMPEFYEDALDALLER